MKALAPHQVHSFVLDTCKLVDRGVYKAGAILFKGRKKIDLIQWNDKTFENKYEADAFARQHFQGLGIREAVNEGELPRAK